MTEYFKKIGTQISDFFLGLSMGKKVALVVTLTSVMGSILYLFYWAGTKNYQPLMTNLTPEDSNAIMRVLRDKKIPFIIDATGKNISIPPESIHTLRLELATSGLPQADVVGYELFDKQSLGTTNYVQTVNHKRALEGELMRTISAMKGVNRARVHLAIPKKSTFIEDHKNPTASVVLELDPGVHLGEKEIYGIGRLVASAVEGLEPANVNIVDSNGKMLSKNVRDSLVELTANQADFRRKIEEGYEKRLVEMFSRIVGDGRVVASVSADLDFSEVEEATTTFDADGSAIRSVQKQDVQAKGSRPGPYGAAGARANTPGDQIPGQPDSMVRTDTTNMREVVNYDVPQTIRKTKKDSGKVKKLSVAVIMDGKVTKTQDKDGKVLSKVEPWSPERLKEFETLITSAVGLDVKRGDTLQIKNMEFTHEDFDEAEKLVQETERRAYLKNLVIYSVIAMLIILFFVFVVRPFIKWITENTIDSVDTFLPQTVEELEKIQKQQAALPGLEEVVPILPDRLDPEKVEGEMIKEKIVTLIDTNPRKAALILKDWIKMESKKKDSGATAGKGA